MSDIPSLQERIRAAAAARRPLRVRAGGSKDFYGNAPTGELLDVSPLAGITHCEPTELVIAARSGTPLAQVEALLASHGQMLACEPPAFAGRATIGGAVACGLSGPRRAYGGALRDFVLGVEMLDGRGRLLRFGGRVIKNVAGFDVSRLMTGSLGTLGVLTEVTLKTVPRPRSECTLRLEMTQPQALEAMTRWAARPLPLSATVWHDGILHLRLSGAEAAVRAARQTLGGELVEAQELWEGVREQRLPFFAAADELWRLSLPAGAPPLPLEGPSLIEWGGALRWLSGPREVGALQSLAAGLGGHATCYRAPAKPPGGAFQPLPPAMLALHRRLKAAFDPQGILNPGRLHPEL